MPSSVIKLRVEDQITWYSNKSAYNSGRSNTWGIVIAVFEFGAIIFAALRLAGNFNFDTSGILATAAAAGVAWLQSKQHETLAQSYSVTAQELAAVNSVLSDVTEEEDWSAKVIEAEDAISREHTLWLASHKANK